MFDVQRRHNTVFTSLSRGFATASSVAFCPARKRITYFTFMFSWLTVFWTAATQRLQAFCGTQPAWRRILPSAYDAVARVSSARSQTCPHPLGQRSKANRRSPPSLGFRRARDHTQRRLADGFGVLGVLHTPRPLLTRSPSAIIPVDLAGGAAFALFPPCGLWSFAL